MIRWVQLAAAPTPDGRAELRLMQRGSEYAITIGGNELMNSRLGGSEAAQSTLACERLANVPAPRLLIGGLGMGFTLRAALAGLGPRAQITVAELTPAVVAWARGPLAAVFGDSLDDPRVEIIEDDVAALIRAAEGRYDAILLDVDNGPGGLVSGANDGLYAASGLAAAARALRPGGLLSVWSAAPDERFASRLRQAGYAVNEQRVRAHGRGTGARHVIWTAVAPARAQASGVEACVTIPEAAPSAVSRRRT